MISGVYKINDDYVVDITDFKKSELKKKLYDSGYVNKAYNKLNGSEIEIAVMVKFKTTQSVVWKKEILEIIRSAEKSSASETDIDFIQNIADSSESNFDCILVIFVSDTSKYFINFGKAYTFMEGMIDSDFGISIAERCVKFDDRSSDSTIFAYQAKLRQSTSFKIGSADAPVPSESFIGIKGKPKVYMNDEEVKDLDLGNTISCGRFVMFHKFDSISDIKTLIEVIETVLKCDVRYSYPKMMVLKSDDSISIEIKKQLNSDLKLKNFDHITLETLLFNNNGDVTYLEKNKNFRIENLEEVDGDLKSHKPSDVDSKLFSMDDFNLDTISTFMNEFEVKDYNKLRINFTGDSKCKYYLKSLIRYENIKHDRSYVLVDGKIHYFNDSFMEQINLYLDSIDLRLNGNLGLSDGDEKLMLPPFVTKDQSGNRIRRSLEEDYHDVIARKINDDINVHSLHKMFVTKKKAKTSKNVPIEIADVFIEEHSKSRLIALKAGLTASSSIYSLVQMTLGMNVLKNLSEYDTSNLGSVMVSKIRKTKQVCVCWILSVDSETPNKNSMAFKVLENDYRLRDINSDLVKTKIFEWAVAAKSMDLTPVIYIEVAKQIIK